MHTFGAYVIAILSAPYLLPLTELEKNFDKIIYKILYNISANWGEGGLGFPDLWSGKKNPHGTDI